MSQTFDPYRKWLGIPPEEQPPHHYRLLGIAAFEDDPDVIAYAADRQMSHVRKFQTGRQSQFSQRILNELAQARVCLLDRQRKAVYDEQLQRELGRCGHGRATPAAVPRPSKAAPVPSLPPGALPPQPAPPLHGSLLAPPAIPPEPAPPPSVVLATMEPPQSPTTVAAASPAPPGVRTRPAASAARRARRQGSPIGLILGLCAVGGLLMVMLVVAALSNNLSDDDEDTGTQSGDFASYNPPATTGNDQQPRPPKRPRPEQRPKPPEPDPGSSNPPPLVFRPEDAPPDPGPAVDDPQRTAKFEEAVAGVEKGLAGRDIAAAAAQLQIAESLQYGAAEKQQVAQLLELLGHLESFWKGVDRALKRLQPGDGITYEETVANFEALDGESITLLDTGNRITAKLRELEVRYLAALAMRGLNPSDPQTKLAVATFLALDDRSPSPAQLEQARKLHDEAVAAGAKSEALAARLHPSEPDPSLPNPGETETPSSDKPPADDDDPPVTPSDPASSDPADDEGGSNNTGESNENPAPPATDPPAFPKPGEGSAEEPAEVQG